MFLEYWKVREVDLSIRWKVRGVSKTKMNRPEYKYERVVVDQYGRTIHYTPKWKQIARQLLQVPFMAVSTAALALMISSVFAVEILISDSYDGPNNFYLVSGLSSSSFGWDFAIYVPCVLIRSAGIYTHYTTSGFDPLHQLLSRRRCEMVDKF